MLLTANADNQAHFQQRYNFRRKKDKKEKKYLLYKFSACFLSISISYCITSFISWWIQEIISAKNDPSGLKKNYIETIILLNPILKIVADFSVTVVINFFIEFFLDQYISKPSVPQSLIRYQAFLSLTENILNYISFFFLFPTKIADWFLFVNKRPRPVAVLLFLFSCLCAFLQLKERHLLFPFMIYIPTCIFSASIIHMNFSMRAKEKERLARINAIYLKELLKNEDMRALDLRINCIRHALLVAFCTIRIFARLLRVILLKLLVYFVIVED